MQKTAITMFVTPILVIFRAYSPLRPAAPQSCPPQTWAGQQVPQAGHRLSPSSAESFPAKRIEIHRNSLICWIAFGNITLWTKTFVLYVSKHILNTHIFQFNVPPLIILEWAQDIDILTSFKKLQDKAGVFKKIIIILF